VKGSGMAVFDADVRAISIQQAVGEQCAAVGADIIRYAVYADQVIQYIHAISCLLISFQQGR
jgi:hypothetical protein